MPTPLPGVVKGRLAPLHHRPVTDLAPLLAPLKLVLAGKRLTMTGQEATLPDVASLPGTLERLEVPIPPGSEFRSPPTPVGHTAPGVGPLTTRGAPMEFIRTILERQPLLALFLTI